MFNKCNLVSKNISKQNFSESASLNYILDVLTVSGSSEPGPGKAYWLCSTLSSSLGIALGLKPRAVCLSTQCPHRELC